MSMEMVKWGWWQGGEGHASLYPPEWTVKYDAESYVPDSASLGTLAWTRVDLIVGEVNTRVADANCDNGYRIDFATQGGGEASYYKHTTGHPWEDVDNAIGYTVAYRAVNDTAEFPLLIDDGTYQFIVNRADTNWRLYRHTSNWAFGDLLLNVSVTGGAQYYECVINVKGNKVKMWSDGVPADDGNDATLLDASSGTKAISWGDSYGANGKTDHIAYWLGGESDPS